MALDNVRHLAMGIVVASAIDEESACPDPILNDIPEEEEEEEEEDILTRVDVHHPEDICFSRVPSSNGSKVSILHLTGSNACYVCT